MVIDTESSAIGDARRSGPKWLLAAEGAAIVVVFALDAWYRLPAAKPLSLLVVAWVSLRMRGVRWREVGLRHGPGLRRLAYLAIVGGVALETFQLTITQPIVAMLIGAAPDLRALASLQGDAMRLSGGLMLAWGLGAFADELVWRGYALNRMLSVLGRSRLPQTLAVSLAALLSGVAHAEQGAAGVVAETVSGLILGATYLGCDRELPVPIAVHGVVNTITVLLGYFGRLPTA